MSNPQKNINHHYLFYIKKSFESYPLICVYYEAQENKKSSRLINKFYKNNYIKFLKPLLYFNINYNYNINLKFIYEKNYLINTFLEYEKYLIYILYKNYILTLPRLKKMPLSIVLLKKKLCNILKSPYFKLAALLNKVLFSSSG